MDDKKFIQVDALRCIAVLMVLLSHWHWFGIHMAEALHLGARGVDLFFVISGFLITYRLILSKEREPSAGISLYKFYAKRFLRIFPAYYLTLAICWVFLHDKIADSIVWNLLYISNFYNIKIQNFGPLGFLWSLSVEEQFYLFWPFLILFIPVIRMPIVIGVSILSSLLVKIYWMHTGITFWTPYVHPLGSLDILALGALLAYMYHFHKDRLKALINKNTLAILIIAQLVVCYLSPFVLRDHRLFDAFVRTSWGIFCLWLIGKTVFSFTGIAGKLLEYRPITYIGKISYGIYLYHILVPFFLEGMKYPQSGSLRFPIYLVVTIAVASLSWYLFERPLLKLKKRFE